MLGLTWLLYLAFGVIYRSMAPLVTPIIADLGISFSQMGIIIGAWSLSYIVSSVFAGTLIDKWGVRYSLLLGGAIVALSGVLRFFPKTFWGMMLAVGIFGFGGSFISIGCPKTISQWFQGKERGTAVGIYMTGLRIGELITFSLTNSVIMPLLGYSWRATLLTFGFFGLFVVFVWYIFARNITDEKDSATGFFDILFNLIKIKEVAILLIIGPILFAIIHGFVNWLPGILELKGLSQNKASIIASIPMITGTVSVVFIPALTNPKYRKLIVAVLSLIMAFTIIATIYFRSTGIYIMLGLYGVSSASIMPVIILMLMDTPEIGSRYIGSLSGMFFCLGQIGGFVGPSLMGFFADITGNFNSGILFLSFLCLIIFTLTFFIRGSSKIV